MREPHWLAGMTSRSVTGGLLVTVPFATRAAKSLRAKHRMDDMLTESCGVAFMVLSKEHIFLIQGGLEPWIKICKVSGLNLQALIHVLSPLFPFEQ